MDVISYVIGKNSGGGGGNKNAFIDESITYSSGSTIKSLIVSIDDLTLPESTIDMSSFFDGCTNLKAVPMIDTSKVKVMTFCFSSCKEITSMPLWDTHLVTNMQSMFYMCSKLADVPVLDTSVLLAAGNMFQSCNNLTDESLNNILKMCINATIYTGTKTLNALGIKKVKYSQSKIESLSNYADFIAAGWTTGY